MPLAAPIVRNGHDHPRNGKIGCDLFLYIGVAGGQCACSSAGAMKTGVSEGAMMFGVRSYILLLLLGLFLTCAAGATLAGPPRAANWRDMWMSPGGRGPDPDGQSPGSGNPFIGAPRRPRRVPRLSAEPRRTGNGAPRGLLRSIGLRQFVQTG